MTSSVSKAQFKGTVYPPTQGPTKKYDNCAMPKRPFWLHKLLFNGEVVKGCCLHLLPGGAQLWGKKPQGRTDCHSTRTAPKTTSQRLPKLTCNNWALGAGSYSNRSALPGGQVGREGPGLPKWPRVTPSRPAFTLLHWGTRMYWKRRFVKPIWPPVAGSLAWRPLNVYTTHSILRSL